MDRQTVYRGQIVYETDLLWSERYAYEAIGLLSLDILGNGPLASGLPCTQTGPVSLNVQVGTGRVYMLENIEPSAWGAVSGVGGLPADNAHQILKQGIQRDPILLAITPPATTGFSTNYLVQAEISETDIGSTVLPFFNASDPSMPWAGPGNSGGSLPVIRQDGIAINAKAGTPASTGTQTTPTPDAGFVGLYVVTVANGATAIHNGNISVYGGAPFITETLTQKISKATADTLYQPVGGVGGFGTQTAIVSAATTDLGTIATNNAKITGTVTITSFGNTAVVTEPLYKIEFAGALTLTHNGTSLILPGGTNITTAVGDTAECEYLGSGNWRVREYTFANGSVLPASLGTTASTAAAGNDSRITGSLKASNNLSDLASLTTALANLGFTGNITPNGYAAFPGGLIIQWGTVSFTPTGGNAWENVAIPFTINFPHQCFVCLATGQNKFDASNPTTAGAEDIVIVYNYTASGAEARIDNNATNALSGVHTFAYIAIGN